MFFHPEFIDEKWRSPIDEVIDKAIQGSPIDCRRKLYNVSILYIIIRILYYLVDLHCLMDSLTDYRHQFKIELILG